MPRLRSRPPASLYVAGPFAMGYTEFYNFLIPLYGLSLGMSAGAIGMLVGARSLLAVFLSIHVGVLMDRFGTRRVTLFFVWSARDGFIEAQNRRDAEYRADVNNLPPGTGNSIGWCQQTPRRAASGQRRAHLFAPGIKAAQFCRSSPRRWCTACCSTADARSALNSRAEADQGPPSNASMGYGRCSSRPG